MTSPSPSFRPEQYGPIVAPLLTIQESMSLGPATTNRAAESQLKGLSAKTLFPQQHVKRPEMAELCLAGLWLLHGYLDESHDISQRIKSSEGSYWHGLMHRREPDFSNAEYWFARVGYHSVMQSLAEQVPAMARKADLDAYSAFLAEQQEWNAAKFVDLCKAVLNNRSKAEGLCLQIATLEWELLFDHCYWAAIGE